MDPLWASIAELWWVAPIAVGAGVFGMLGLRHQRALDARRLELDAARLELHDARAQEWSSRSTLKLARAEFTRAQAERAASRATPSDVAAARRALQSAQRDVRAASANVRVRRMRVSAARSGLAATSDPAHRPLTRVMVVHDTINARWLAYETDPARLIAFPLMSDGRVPTTAAYLTARAEAQDLRPGSAQARITPVQYVAYRNAVDRLGHAFEAAEKEAWREARASGMAPPEPKPEPAAAAWTAAAQQFLERSSAALAWATENAAWVAARVQDAAPPRPEKAPAPSAAPSPPPPSAERREPVWPVPSRSTQRPAS
ncbi:hypothetical protein ACH3VR_15235 [Microbacterium sp. B2969]|uniref:Uncharacterized protein n=1 Tax=Microbacterium alkaliflavum TaxID=3248839 RepID=A0ABW7Q9Z4_9MICO